MPGHMGNKNRSVYGAKVIVDFLNSLLLSKQTAGELQVILPCLRAQIHCALKLSI